MMIFKRSAALAALVAFAAACGGGESAQVESGTEQATTTETAAPAPAAAPAAPAVTPAPGGTVHEVKALTTQNGASGVFEPANITVKKGDVIRFVSSGNAAHNVSFPAADNAGAANLPADSPFLTDGQSYEMLVTMDAGTYNYVCTPHAALGMVGTVTVQ